MKCEEYGRLVHLFLDGRLDEDEEKRLKDHLAVCKGCAEKLALLQAVEEKAKTIEPVEPPAEYWDTFSGRVMATIDAGRERKAASGLRRALAGLFTVSPSRLRIAAGVVSVAVVVIVGILFFKERGGEIVTTRRVVETERSPVYESGRREVGQEAGVERSKREIDKHAEKPFDIEVARNGVKKEKEVPSEESVPGEKKAFEEAEPRDRTEGRETETAEMIVTEESVAAPKAEAPSIERETATKRIDSAGPVLGRKTGKSEDFRGEKINKSALSRMTAAPPGATGDHYILNGMIVYRIEEGDTAIRESELKNLIQAWMVYIDENPQDSLILHGYEQVATAYYLLAIRTRDEAVVSEGSRLIEEYIALTDDPRLLEILSRKLHDIQRLQKK